MKTLIVLCGALIVLVAFIEAQNCPNDDMRYSKSKKKCVCKYVCQDYPNIVQDKECQCVCKEPRKCNARQWYDSYECECKCFELNRKCPAPMTYNKDTCECECPYKPCIGNQVVGPPSCDCDCSNAVKEKDICESLLPPLYAWNSTQCSCYSPLVEFSVKGAQQAKNPTNPFGYIISMLTQVGAVAGEGFKLLLDAETTDPLDIIAKIIASILELVTPK